MLVLSFQLVPLPQSGWKTMNVALNKESLITDKEGVQKTF